MCSCAEGGGAEVEIGCSTGAGAPWRLLIRRKSSEELSSDELESDRARPPPKSSEGDPRKLRALPSSWIRTAGPPLPPDCRC